MSSLCSGNIHTFCSEVSIYKLEIYFHKIKELLNLLFFDFLKYLPLVLRSLGQEVFCSVQEADYEIASYARQHGCMGILGQDSDFMIYDRFVKMMILCH